MERGKSYLVSYEDNKNKKVVNEIKILESTTTCYKIEFQTSVSGFMNNANEWITKEDFNDNYLVLEEYEKNNIRNEKNIPPPPEPPPSRLLKEGKELSKPPKSWRSI